MIERERIIEAYFESWISKNKAVLRKTFDPDIVYSESYGPEYRGIDTVEKWFDDWNQRGNVLAWKIKQFIHQGDLTAVEWYFNYDYDAEVDEFDGVSWIEFNRDNLIVNLKEFQSKLPHYDPYN